VNVGIDDTLTGMGKLIVIEGGDGSGKTEQVKLLARHLNEAGHQVKIWDFPQYGKTIAGDLVGEMLKGKFGDLMAIHPLLAAMPYALDRVAVREEMVEWMERGGVALCNRYTGSNLAHGAAKFENRKDAINFMEEVIRMEFGDNGLPIPDVSLYLATDAELSRELVLRKSGREYLEGKVMTDQAERDLEHQRKARGIYEFMCERVTWFARIECMGGPGKIESIEVIHERVWAELNRRLIV